jgi:hypothetical protein
VLVIELEARACSDIDPNAVQSTNHMMLYGNDFGPNYSITTMQTIRVHYRISN